MQANRFIHLTALERQEDARRKRALQGDVRQSPPPPHLDGERRIWRRLQPLLGTPAQF